MITDREFEQRRTASPLQGSSRMPPPCASTSDAQSTSAQNQRLVDLNEYRIILMQMNKLIHGHDGIKYLSHSLFCFLFHARPFLSLSLSCFLFRARPFYSHSLSLSLHPRAFASVRIHEVCAQIIFRLFLS